MDEYAGGLKMVARQVYSLAEARSTYSKGLEIRLDASLLPSRFPHDLRELLTAYRSEKDKPGAQVRLRYRRPDAEAAFALGEAWRVSPADELLKRLRQSYGPEAVQVLY